ncbi:ISP domain-containing protein [Thozetella sp. PMI_491]|nr:ISP domain-containing protein [Thozetella sp. PMI_491]
MILSTLPASWFREPDFYELERRTVFSKTWLIVSHKFHFAELGNYARYEVAGYPFFILRDRKGNINAFLNVCRHRAFPLVHDESGTVKSLACKYHVEDWSYGFSGNLAKAPKFDMIPQTEFNKDEYSLYKLHLHIDHLGFLWVNLDASMTPVVSWDEQFKEVDTEERITKFYNMEDYVFHHSWSLDGCAFNWKTLVENYNECYHCSTAHPGIAPHINGHQVRQMEAGNITASPTFMYPNSSVTMSQHFFYMMFIIPTSATTSRMRYEEEVDLFKQVENEGKWSGNNVQPGLNSDTYVAGPLHPYMEKANHVKMENETGRQIWPARRTLASERLEEDEEFCRGVCARKILSLAKTIYHGKPGLPDPGTEH